MKNNNLIYHGLYTKTLIVYTIFIFIICLVPLPNLKSDSAPFFDFKHLDKVFHFCCYFLWVALYLSLYQKLLLALVLSSFIGISIEFIQPLTGYRSFQFYDIITNMFGSLSGLLLFYLFPNLLKKIDHFLKTKFQSLL